MQSEWDNMYLNLRGPKPSNVCEDTNMCLHVLAKLIKRQRGHKMHRYLWTRSMPAKTQHVTTTRSLAREDTKCISTCIDPTPPMSLRAQNVSLHVLSKPIPCLRGHKIYLNLCWPNPFILQRKHRKHLNLCWTYLSHASVDTKCITFDDHTNPIQNASQYVLTKRIPRERENKIYLKMCWQNPSHTREDTKCISKYVDHASEDRRCLVLAKRILCQLGHKIYFNMCWTILSHASENTNCFTTC